MSRLALFPALLLCLSALQGCSDEAATDSRPTIAAAFYPLQYVAERVAGDDYTVENLTTPGSEPHDLDLGIQETVLLTNADLVIYEEGFQPAVDASVIQNAEGATLDAASVVELAPRDEGDELDPHFWLDPLRMADLGDEVAERLSDLDPEGAKRFDVNAQSLRADLETLNREYADGLSACERSTVVVNHDAFGYLEKYGLELEAILGISPDAEPTAADLQQVKSIVASEGVTTLFSETLVSPKLSQTLAEDLGIMTDVLDPLEGLSEENVDADYLSVMATNLGALQEANGCR